MDFHYVLIFIACLYSNSYAMDLVLRNNILREDVALTNKILREFDRVRADELIKLVHYSIHNGEKAIMLPPKEELQKLFCKQRLDHFIQTTDVVRDLAQSTLHPTTVCIIINHSICRYTDLLKNPLVWSNLWERRIEIAQYICAHDPEALKAFNLIENYLIALREIESTEEDYHSEKAKL